MSHPESITLAAPATTPLVLASASPRRQELLREAGYAFHVFPADVDETNHPPGLSPAELAEFLAAAKAAGVAARFPNAVVLAADTVVASGNDVFGKPADEAGARAMLARLAGTTHAVITAVAVVHRASGFSRTRRVTSQVSMRPLSRAEVDAYVATNQWQGKAGGYGIQDPDPFVTRMMGSLTNIVGLPMDETRELLAAAGAEPEGVRET